MIRKFKLEVHLIGTANQINECLNDMGPAMDAIRDDQYMEDYKAWGGADVTFGMDHPKPNELVFTGYFSGVGEKYEEWATHMKWEVQSGDFQRGMMYASRSQASDPHAKPRMNKVRATFQEIK